MDVIECIKTRRSIRELHCGEVNRKVIEQIVNCGRLAPTAKNIQPVEFVVVTDRNKLKKLAEIVAGNGPFIKDAVFCIVVFAKDTKYFLEDGCAATENILLAVHSFGLSACWVAGDKKNYAQTIAKELDAPPDYKLISIIPVGYSNEKSNIRKRKLEDVLHWEKF
ncbi:MAG: nitroreductase family protein [Elusimicrobiota bacterium]